MQVWSLGPEDPRRRAWPPTPVFLRGESRGQRNLVGYGPRGHKELDTTGGTQHAQHNVLSARHEVTVHSCLPVCGWHLFDICLQHKLQSIFHVQQEEPKAPSSSPELGIPPPSHAQELFTSAPLITQKWLNVEGRMTEKLKNFSSFSWNGKVMVKKKPNTFQMNSIIACYIDLYSNFVLNCNECLPTHIKLS